MIAILLSFGAHGASAFETRATAAYLVDVASGTVLFEKNGDEPMAPASMSKMMTIYMLMDRVAEGELALSDKLPVSEKAWRMGGSRMFVEVGTRVGVEELLRGLIIHSGNDAAVVVAEALGGTEERFAEMMTEKAIALGMNGSNFANATGWPHPDHYMTPKDLAILAERTVLDFPNLYEYYSERSFKYNNISQDNRNPLLYRDIGADGMKTGHTEASGYGLVSSVERNGRRLILVVNGLQSARARGDESERLLQYGFREFKTITLYQRGDVVTDATVWTGDSDQVSLVAARDFTVSIPRRANKSISMKAVFEQPLPAPLSQGSQAGVLHLSAEDMPETAKLPLLVGSDVERLGAFGRLISAAHYYVVGR
ncbi:MAG: D-alanyl-D-alanine carboxypeptidase family protein [Pseudomonadota bacterium]